MERVGAILGKRGLLAGQVLLTPHDFGVRSQYLHARETLRRLLDWALENQLGDLDGLAVAAPSLEDTYLQLTGTESAETA